MKLQRLWMVLAVSLLMPMMAAVPAPAAESAEEAGFQALEYKDAKGATLLYRLLKPSDYDPAKGKCPLLVFLHGAGERGSDNKAQLQWGREIMQAAAREHGCFVVVPQCPAGEKWANVNWGKPTHTMSDEPAEPMRLVLELLAKMQKEFAIDADRLYVMGLSMGGYGSWDVIQRHPDMFAAAVPICGGGDETAANRIKTPVWAFHGDKDGAVPVDRSRNMINAIKAAGGTPKYTEYAGVGHNSWSKAFADPELPKWLFSQTRAEK